MDTRHNGREYCNTQTTRNGTIPLSVSLLDMCRHAPTHNFVQLPAIPTPRGCWRTTCRPFLRAPNLPTRLSATTPSVPNTSEASWSNSAARPYPRMDGATLGSTRRMRLLGPLPGWYRTADPCSGPKASVSHPSWFCANMY